MSTQNVTEMPLALEPDGIECQIYLIKIASSASALEPMSFMKNAMRANSMYVQCTGGKLTDQ